MTTLGKAFAWEEYGTSTDQKEVSSFLSSHFLSCVLSLSLSHYFTRLLVLLHPPTSFQAPPPETLGLEHSGGIRDTSRTLLMCSLMIKLCFSLLLFFFLPLERQKEKDQPEILLVWRRLSVCSFHFSCDLHWS